MYIPVYWIRVKFLGRSIDVGTAGALIESSEGRLRQFRETPEDYHHDWYV